MTALGNFLFAIGYIANQILGLYIIILIVAVLISWVNPDPYNPIVRFLRGVTEPVLRPVRRKLGIYGGIDFSPIIVILGIYFVKLFLIQTIIDYGRKLKGGF